MSTVYPGRQWLAMKSAVMRDVCESCCWGELLLVGPQCLHPDLRIPCTSKALVPFREAVRHQPLRRRVVGEVLKRA